MSDLQTILVTIVATVVALWLIRAAWRYAARVDEAVRHAERFGDWAQYRANEFRRMSDDQYTLQRRVDKLEGKS